jgi:CubicO group peptidase (beta-lactamase class C family)
MRIRLILLLFIATITQAAPPRDISPLLDPIIAKHDVPGMVAAIIDSEIILAQGASGVRRRGDAQKVTDADKFHIGSCTKTMTATLCAILVEEGKLSWDRTLVQAFPELKTKMHEQYRAVTLEQLLSNRGGVPLDIWHDEVWSKLLAYRGPAMGSRKLLLESVIVKPPEAPPGEKYIYSNAGFAIAGHMAERAMNEPWEQLLNEKLFKPLGMKSTGFGPPGTENSLSEPRGHNAEGKPVEPGPLADNPAGIGPAGTVHCALGDWAKFVSLHLSQNKLLKPETFKKLHTAVGTYALGWGVQNRGWAKGPVLLHSGSNTMWCALVTASPEDKIAILVICNQGGENANKACNEATAVLVQNLNDSSLKR